MLQKYKQREDLCIQSRQTLFSSLHSITRLNWIAPLSRLRVAMERKAFLFILIVYILGFSLHALYLKQTVYGDGIFYYSWVRSIIVDHDVNFANEYAHFHTSQPSTPLNLPGNKYSVGPSLLWSPWFVWTHLLARGTGYELVYQFVVGLSSVFYAYIGLLLLYRLLIRRFGKTVSLASAVAIAGATNLLFYGSLDTVNSHAVSFFAAVLFLTFLFQKSKNWLLIGAALGLVTLVRTQDIILGLLVVPYLQKKYIYQFFIGLFLLFLPQLIAWQLLYGKFWISPYLGSTEGFNFLHPQIPGVLFSPENGLFLWTPMVLIGFVGLGIKRDGFLLKLMAIIVLLQLYLVASWSTWWQGASYSGRMFVSILPFIAFGIANIFSHFKNRLFRFPIIIYAISLPLSIINVLLITYFLAVH